MRLSPGLAVIICAIGALVPLHSYTPSDDQAASKFAWFVDVTSSRAVHFQYLASHTSRKYLPETMGAGVALFDYDNDKCREGMRAGNRALITLLVWKKGVRFNAEYLKVQAA